jgi:hypothetical protein
VRPYSTTDGPPGKTILRKHAGGYKPVTVYFGPKPEPEPKREYLPFYEALLEKVQELKLLDATGHFWGCFLLAQCKPLPEIGRPAYHQLAIRLLVDIDTKLKAMQDAACSLAWAIPSPSVRLPAPDGPSSVPATPQQPPVQPPKSRKGKGGRPPLWDELWKLMLKMKRENPNIDDKDIAAEYNKRFAAPISKGKRKKATVETVRQVRYERTHHRHSSD